jgi:dihydrolipoamide dehydrogenase
VLEQSVFRTVGIQANVDRVCLGTGGCESIMGKGKHVDVVIIGSGPGGYVAAIRAAQRGMKVAVIERDSIGGVCLNRGCIPTKAFVRAAELYRDVQEAEQVGVSVDGCRLDIVRVLARKNEVVSKLRSGVESLLKANGVEVIHGRGEVVDRGLVEVVTDDGRRQMECGSIIVATGSEPVSIPGLETDGARVLNSSDALELDQLPQSLAVIGGGYIGLEFASIYAAFGTKVTVIEMLPQLLLGQDKEISKRLRGYLKAKGVDIYTEARFEKMRALKDDKLEITASGKKGPVKVVAEKVLVAVGRKLNSDAVFAEGMQVSVENGAVGVNERLETSVPDIYAIGDVTGKMLLAHVASAQGLVAAANAAGGNETIDYATVPACVFCSPEVASVGLTEEDARQRGINVKVGRFPFSASGRALILGQTEGFAKLVLDADTGELLGGHVIGPDASHLIAEIALAVGTECTVEEIAHTIHAHPTLSETWMEAAEEALGFPIHQMPKRSSR